MGELSAGELSLGELFSNHDTPPSSEVAIFTWKISTVLNQMKNKFSDYYISSYGWLYLQFTSMSPQFPCVSQTKKKLFRSDKTYKKDAHCSDTDFLVPEFFCIFFLIFQIWSILYKTFVVNWYIPLFPLRPLHPPLGGSTTRPRMLLNWIPLANCLSCITG